MSDEPTPPKPSQSQSADRMVISEEELMAEKHKPRKSKKSTSSQSTTKNSKNQKSKEPKTPRTKKQKIILGILITLAVLLLIGLGVIIFLLLQKPETIELDKVEFPEPTYSILTGEEISDAKLNSNPTFCVQIPNGNDGGRPQVGLNQAGIVFEAIAEAGITRFAAIFQNADTNAIGPIRSLRPYYLDWDTPFDCTVVHAGGSDEAMAALRAGGQRDLNESLEYMWRERSSDRGWNNLFTSPEKLAEFNASKGYDKSEIKAFPRLTPDDAETLVSERFSVTEFCDPESDDCEIETETVVEEADNPDYIPAKHINMVLGNSGIFNIVYSYDSDSNSYHRAYANGEPHMVYPCLASALPPGSVSVCSDLVQLSPKAIVAMSVEESRMADGYHENIKTLGSGKAYIFQNGEAIEGTWTKNSHQDQIIFRDNNGEEIRFTPGQLWITAIPQYGGVTWE